MTYPIFNDPEGYLRIREGRSRIYRRLKRHFEHRAIQRCLRHTRGIQSVGDVPCGPGRLFEFWSNRGMDVYGYDLSEDMLAAASVEHRRLDLRGEIRRQDVFEPGALPKLDLYASVRFCYYFEREQRIELLRSLASASVRYVLVQYKSLETRKGRRNAARKKDGGGFAKHFCAHADIQSEIESSGLQWICTQIIDQSSDRVFALAEK